MKIYGILKLPKIQKFKESVKSRFSKSSRRLEIIALKYLNQYNVITSVAILYKRAFSIINLVLSAVLIQRYVCPFIS